MKTSRCIAKYGLILALFGVLSGCVTSRIAPVTSLETATGAINVPYRISSSGRILVDVSVNGEPPRPLSVDTGATVSVLYSAYARSADIDVSDRTIFVRGLVGQGDRPIIEDVTFGIGPQLFPLDQIVMLETPFIKDEAVGLLGGDILGGYTALFNRQTMIATFVPRGNVAPDAFKGWSHIPLQTSVDADTNTRLYFAETSFDGQTVPVLIDTGSNLNFINWKLATMDRDIRRLERRMIKDGTLQGALDATPVTLETVFYDLQLGRHAWDEIKVVVMGLTSLASVAPVDEPMMVVGADVFAPLTLAFDLTGRMMYIYPDGAQRTSRRQQRNLDQTFITDKRNRQTVGDLTPDPVNN